MFQVFDHFIWQIQLISIWIFTELGTLRFGKIDVTEAQYGIMFLHMLTFFFGGSLWEHHVSVCILYSLNLIRFNFKS